METADRAIAQLSSKIRSLETTVSKQTTQIGNLSRQLVDSQSYQRDLESRFKSLAATLNQVENALMNLANKE